MKRQRPPSLEKEEQIEETHKESASKPQSTSKSLHKLTKIYTNFHLTHIKYENKLDRKYFRQQVVELSKSLLGKILVRKTAQGIIKAVIVETQAYKAPLDKECHAYNNKKTEKTKYFWLDGGHLYIYTIYMPSNVCLNVVAGLQGEPQAVLIRAVQPIQGLPIVRSYRDIKSNKIQDMSNGPGKVGQALGINKQTMNGIDLLDGDFHIIDGGITQFQTQSSRRVNIDYAAQWIDKPWRFFIKGNTFVSKVNFNAKSKSKGKQ